MKKYKGIILIVDDEKFLTDSLGRSLKKLNYFVHGFNNGQAAIYAIRNQGINYDLALVDLSFPTEPDGVEITECSKNINPETPVLGISAGDVQFMHTDGFIKKEPDMIKSIEKAFKKYVLKKRRKIK